MAQGYEVIAVRYATRLSSRQESFLRYYAYGEPDAPLKMDYYFWILRHDGAVILVDTGVDVDGAKRPGRTIVAKPLECLQELGIARESVSLVIVTHCHSDHIGNLAAFPNATFVVQRRELEFWTGPIAQRLQFATTVKADQIEFLSRANESGRVRLLDGDAQVVDGVSVRLVGGHSPGQQIVLVDSPGGPVLLTSDALHFYEELERQMPFSVLWNLGEVYEAYDLILALARDRGAVVVPGHDPAVMDRFAPYGDRLAAMVRIA